MIYALLICGLLRHRLNYNLKKIVNVFVKISIIMF
jgi:hypothetical protein